MTSDLNPMVYYLLAFSALFTSTGAVILVNCKQCVSMAIFKKRIIYLYTNTLFKPNLYPKTDA